MLNEQNVVVDKHTAAVIEQKTHQQSESAFFKHHGGCASQARCVSQLPVAAPRNFLSFVEKKPQESFVGNKITKHGQRDEKQALEKYIELKNEEDVVVSVAPSGLIVSLRDPSLGWNARLLA